MRRVLGEFFKMSAAYLFMILLLIVIGHLF
jgi:hypothetical protein